MQDDSTRLSKPLKMHGLLSGIHSCWLSNGGEEYASGVLYFAQDGISANERVLIISSEERLVELQEILHPILPDSEDLELASIEEVLISPGEIDPNEMVKRLREMRYEALADGYRGFRIFLDMSWLSGQRSGVNQVARLCTRIDTLLLEDNVQLLAYYDRRIFSPTRLLDILPLYQHVVLKGVVSENVYYAAVEDRLKRHRHEAILDHVLNQLEPNSKKGKHQSSSELDPVGAENALRMLKAIIDSMGDGVIVTNEVGDLLLINKSASAILGYAKSDEPMAQRIRTIGNFLPDRVTPYPLDELPITKAIKGESVDQAEIFIKNDRRPQGVWVSTTGRPLLSPEGELRGGVVVFRDISEQKKAETEKELFEAQMWQTQKLESLGLLAGGVAHDFNNLLMGILGNAGMALTACEDSENRARIENIKTTAVRLSDLTNQLLDYSGQGSYAKGAVELNSLVEELFSLLQPVVSKKAKVAMELTEGQLVTKADATQIRQVVMNLVTNASDALGNEPGLIKIRTGIQWASREYLERAFLHEGLPESDYVFVEVSDTGVGMPPEMLKKIFDPFFTTKTRGRGLGLAAVLGLVRRHKGAMFIDSEPGVGTTFRVLFPEAQIIASEPTTENFDSDLSTGTVLVVDDEDVVRNVAKQILEHSGFTVLTAASGREGINVFKNESPTIDAVLLDMSMPDMDGKQVFEELLMVSPDARVVLSSGYTEIETLDQFPEQSLSGFLQKPYAPEVLVNKLQQVIRRSGIK